MRDYLWKRTCKKWNKVRWERLTRNLLEWYEYRLFFFKGTVLNDQKLPIRVSRKTSNHEAQWGTHLIPKMKGKGSHLIYSLITPFNPAFYLFIIPPSLLFPIQTNSQTLETSSLSFLSPPLFHTYCTKWSLKWQTMQCCSSYFLFLLLPLFFLHQQLLLILNL